MTAGTGIVRSWNEEEGWGVVDSPDTPGGCWVHFSHISAPGYRSLQPGQQVTLDWEPPGQDGFPYRATAVRLEPEQPRQPEQDGNSSSAYGSNISLT